MPLWARIHVTRLFPPSATPPSALRFALRSALKGRNAMTLRVLHSSTSVKEAIAVAARVMAEKGGRGGYKCFGSGGSMVKMLW